MLSLLLYSSYRTFLNGENNWYSYKIITHTSKCKSCKLGAVGFISCSFTGRGIWTPISFCCLNNLRGAQKQTENNSHQAQSRARSDQFVALFSTTLFFLFPLNKLFSSSHSRSPFSLFLNTNEKTKQKQRKFVSVLLPILL